MKGVRGTPPGRKALDELVALDGSPIVPPDQPMFPMGTQVSLALRRGTEELTVKITIPAPRSRKQPYVEPKPVTSSGSDHGIGYLKVAILPGLLGLDVSRAIDAAVAELSECDRLILDLRGHRGSGLGVLRIMSHLTAGKLPIGYTVTRRRAEAGFEKESLRKLDRLPTDLTSRRMDARVLAASRYSPKTSPILINMSVLRRQRFTEALSCKPWVYKTGQF
jgi:carboxyl-terminal processing protease